MRGRLVGTPDGADAERPAAGPANGNPETRERILAAAREVFARHGYIDATVEDIVRQAGVSRGTFYYYFKNRSDVFEALARATTEALLVEAGAPATEDDLYLRIEAANYRYLQIWDRYKDVYRTLLQVATFEPRFLALWKELRAPFLQRIERNLARAVEAGRARPLSPAIMAWSLGNMLDRAAYLGSGTGELEEYGFTLEEIARELSELWYHSVYGGRPHLGGRDGTDVDPSTPYRLAGRDTG